MKRSNAIVIVEGLVTASDWDENGNPTDLKICSSGEIDYTVVKNRVSTRLFENVRKQVIVEGTLSNNGLEKSINIKTILSSSDPKISTPSNKLISNSSK